VDRRRLGLCRWLVTSKYYLEHDWSYLKALPILKFRCRGDAFSVHECAVFTSQVFYNHSPITHDQGTMALTDKGTSRTELATDPASDEKRKRTNRDALALPFTRAENAKIKTHGWSPFTGLDSGLAGTLSANLTSSMEQRTGTFLIMTRTAQGP
jgi:hypothetical protein